MTVQSLAAGTEGVVGALRRLVVFGVDQSGAYRELFGPIAERLGPGVPTRLITWLSDWARGPAAGVVILTGNAGTGKTAAAEAVCRVLGVELPQTDDLVNVGGALLAKDVSGIATRRARADAFRAVLAAANARKALMCANEGVLRDAAEDLAADHPELQEALDVCLHRGAARSNDIVILNLNRQRLTADGLWGAVLDYLTASDLWHGCDGCPAGTGEPTDVGCPLRANAEALRRSDTRTALRMLLQVAAGEAVLTMRETLALLSYAICGDASGDSGESGMWTCEQVRSRARDRGANAFTASSAYFNLLFGVGLSFDTRERSPLLNALARLGPGRTADLEVDDWLRDSGRADIDIRHLAGAPRPDAGDGLLAGSHSPLDRVRTTAGEMTFHRLGELVSISEDEEKVRAGVKALVAAEPPAQQMWRRRVLLEGSSSLGGPSAALTRLIALSNAPDLLGLAQRVARGGDVVTDLKQIIKGLNFLVTGFGDASEGLIVPEPASLFARNPGSFRPARPAFVHAKVTTDRIRLDVLDRGIVEDLLDVDHVEVRLVVDRSDDLGLTIGPRMYQAVREAERFRGPVGHGTAEMTDLRSFYGRVAEAVPAEAGLQVADPSRSALVRVQLPYFPDHD